jgi:TRAP-type C4-dicarboxylate transport system permease small subunit
MDEQTGMRTRPTDAVGRVLFGIARALAIFGGLLCCIVAVLVTVSVTGRYLLSAPIQGDYDLVGIITGCAVFAFLPYCQMIRGNIVVDFFTSGVSPRGRVALDGLGTLLYLLIAALFTWRLYYGAVELRESSQVLAAYNFYRWWTLPFSIACMAVLIAAIAYSLRRDIIEVATGKTFSHPTPTGE